MKKLFIIYGWFLLLLLAVTSCNDKNGIDTDLSFLNTISSDKVSCIFDISNDNSGKVKITPTGEGVSSFLVNFGHGTGSAATASVVAGSNTIHAYPEGNYSVVITSYDIAGQQKSSTIPLKVTYRAPENLAVTLSQTAHLLKVKAKADYAASYLVYYGDATNETGTPLASGAEVSYEYKISGNYSVKVVALSGGSAKTEKITPVIITDPFGLPIDFENAFVTYFFGTFGDAQQFAKVANPKTSGLNTSANVGKFTRGAQGWSGTYSPLNIPIDFASGRKLKVMVFNPDAALIGKKLNVELEAAVGGSPKNGVGVLKVALTKSGEWEELIFDFATISEIPSTAKFNQLVLRFNDTSDGAGAVIYVDNFRFIN